MNEQSKDGEGDEISVEMMSDGVVWG